MDCYQHEADEAFLELVACLALLVVVVWQMLPEKELLEQQVLLGLHLLLKNLPLLA